MRRIILRKRTPLPRKRYAVQRQDAALHATVGRYAPAPPRHLDPARWRANHYTALFGARVLNRAEADLEDLVPTVFDEDVAALADRITTVAQ